LQRRKREALPQSVRAALPGPPSRSGSTYKALRAPACRWPHKLAVGGAAGPGNVADRRIICEVGRRRAVQWPRGDGGGRLLQSAPNDYRCRRTASREAPVQAEPHARIAQHAARTASARATIREGQGTPGASAAAHDTDHPHAGSTVSAAWAAQKAHRG